MQPPKIPTDLALQVVQEIDAAIRTDRPSLNAIDLLAARSGQPWKVALRTLEKLENKHMIECGSSLNWPWLTDQGVAALTRSLAPAMGMSATAPALPPSWRSGSSKPQP